eukprot:9490044-Pyramimonas_sp.AAC.2
MWAPTDHSIHTGHVEYLRREYCITWTVSVGQNQPKTDLMLRRYGSHPVRHFRVLKYTNRCILGESILRTTLDRALVLGATKRAPTDWHCVSGWGWWASRSGGFCTIDIGANVEFPSRLLWLTDSSRVAVSHVEFKGGWRAEDSMVRLQ